MASRPFVYGAVVAGGAAVMVIEVLGTRLVGPVFGVGLFVWAALLSVTMTALAIGYYAGGVLADRFPHVQRLYQALLCAGVFLALSCWLSPHALGISEGLGPRLGPLLAASILFGPSLACLGALGPIATRLLTKDVGHAGHGVGAIYALSTVGSLVGTPLTAFVLIPSFSTEAVLVALAVILGALGAVPLALASRPSALGGVLVLGLTLASGGREPPAGFKILREEQSLYGRLQVIDDVQRGVRFLRADHSIIGAEFPADGTPGFAFVHVLEAARLMRKDANRWLQIGLGIGSLPKILAARGNTVDVVELDPTVVELAKRYFNFVPSGEVFLEDARTFLRHASHANQYDVIVHDTFTDGSTPEHLLSVEVLDDVKRLLKPGGILALNFVGFRNGPGAGATRAIRSTLESRFANTRVFTDEPLDSDPDGLSNLVFFSSDSALELVLSAGEHFESARCAEIARSLAQWELPKPSEGGQVITDEKNPLSALQLPIAEAHFYAMKKLLPADVWLN
jgi:spermidine synthase